MSAGFPSEIFNDFTLECNSCDSGSFKIYDLYNNYHDINNENHKITEDKTNKVITIIYMKRKEGIFFRKEFFDYVEAEDSAMNAEKSEFYADEENTHKNDHYKHHDHKFSSMPIHTVLESVYLPSDVAKSFKTSMPFDEFWILTKAETEGDWRNLSSVIIFAIVLLFFIVLTFYTTYLYKNLKNEPRYGIPKLSKEQLKNFIIFVDQDTRFGQKSSKSSFSTLKPQQTVRGSTAQTFFCHFLVPRRFKNS